MKLGKLSDVEFSRLPLDKYPTWSYIYLGTHGTTMRKLKFYRLDQLLLAILGFDKRI